MIRHATCPHSMRRCPACDQKLHSDSAVLHSHLCMAVQGRIVYVPQPFRRCKHASL